MQEKEVAEQQVADMAQDVERARQRADIEHERNSGQGKELDAAKKVLALAFVFELYIYPWYEETFRKVLKYNKFLMTIVFANGQ